MFGKKKNEAKENSKNILSVLFSSLYSTFKSLFYYFKLIKKKIFKPNNKYLKNRFFWFFLIFFISVCQGLPKEEQQKNKHK